MPRSIPEAQGIPTSAIVDFVTAVEAEIDAVHSFMLVRHGQVVAEGWWHPYGPTIPHSMFSVSKSFTSTAIGLAIGEGLLTLDSKIVELLPDDLPETISPNLAAMTVRDLLTMRSGHATDAADVSTGLVDDNWAKHVLSRPVEFEPGTHFVYNSGATYLLSAIIHSLTGGRLLDYLTPRIMEPLGIVGATWEQCPRGIDVGGWGLSITTEDLAAFGQLYLQRGLWDGRQLVAADWIDEATREHTTSTNGAGDPDWVAGYCYQFWRNTRGGYRMDGAFGQFAIVLPQHDAVVTLTSGVPNMQRLLDLVWEHLLPAFGDEALAAEPPADFTELELRAVDGAPTGTTGKFTLEPNAAGLESVELSPGSLALVLRGTTHAIPFGHRSWVQSTVDMGSGPNSAASSGAWPSPDTFTARVVFWETPLALIVNATFDGDGIELRLDHNVAFGDTHWLTVRGRRQE